MSQFLKSHSETNSVPSTLDGYIQSSSYLDRDLRLLLTHMIELSQDRFYINQEQRLRRVALLQKSITPAMVIEFFLYRKCSLSFLSILPTFAEKNASLIPNFKQIITTYSPYRKMYPTDILVNRRLGITMEIDRDSYRDSKWAYESTKKVFLKEKETDKKDSLAYLKYIHHVLKLEIPFSDKQIYAALRLEDGELLNFVSPQRLKEVVNTVYKKDMSDRTLQGNDILSYYLTSLPQIKHPFLDLDLDSFSTEKLNTAFSSMNMLIDRSHYNLFEQILDNIFSLTQRDLANKALYPAYLKQLEKLVSKYNPTNTSFLIKKAFDKKNADIMDILLTHSPTFPQKNLIQQYVSIAEPNLKKILTKHILKKEKSTYKRQVKKFILKHPSLHPLFLSCTKTKTR